MDIPSSGPDAPQPPSGAPQPPQQPPYQPPPQYQPPAQQYQPPPTPYQPPPAAYQPPATQYQPPAQPPYQPQPAAYPQVPPPPPASQRKGFNWLACCGITCLVLLIIGGGITFCSIHFFKPLISVGMGIAKVSELVQATAETTVISAAVPVTTAELAAAPQTYLNQWLAVNGTVQSSSGSMNNTSFSSGKFNSSDTTPYFLSDNVLVLDVSKAPAVGANGDSVTAYGQIYVMNLDDVGKIPFFGKAILEEMKKDPQFAGQSKMIFVIAKKVERVSVSGMQPPPAAGDGAAAPGTPADPKGAGGWVK